MNSEWSSRRTLFRSILATLLRLYDQLIKDILNKIVKVIDTNNTIVHTFVQLIIFFKY